MQFTPYNLNFETFLQSIISISYIQDQLIETWPAYFQLKNTLI